MKTYTLECVNRTDGKESTVNIEAADETAAFAIAASRGLLVAKVVKVSNKIEKLDVEDDLLMMSFPPYTFHRLMCGLLIVVGMIFMLYSTYMETAVERPAGGFSYDRVHNIGLLNKQVIAMIAGGCLFSCGWIGYLCVSTSVAICHKISDTRKN